MKPQKKSSIDLLLLLIVALFFIATCALVVQKAYSTITKSALENTREVTSKTYPELPVLVNSSSFPTLSAQGVIAVDINSGITLYEKNAEAPLLPASTTKIITALVALDNYSLGQVLEVGREAKVEGQKMNLFYGEKIKVENLLYGLLVYSANDAAEVLANNHSGGYEAFITAMNNKAKELSMLNSYFQNPVGLDGDLQRSTAKDLMRASEVAMRNKTFAKMVGTKEITVTDESGIFSHKLENINKLLGTVDGVTGVKTGWTISARENLVTSLKRENKNIIIVLLGSQDRFGETKEIIDWIFKSYKWTPIKYP